MKEFFQQQPTSLLLELTGGVPVVESLKVELPPVQERRLDLVLLLEAVHRSPMAGLSDPRFAANDSGPAPDTLGVSLLLSSHKVSTICQPVAHNAAAVR